MATETTVRVARARYGGFVATFRWNGETNRVFFENAIELAAELADECVEPQTIEAVIDAYESLEWDDTYPLFRPAEAVCDEPVYPPGTVGYEMGRYQPLADKWNAAIAAQARCQFWKSLCGIAAFGCGLAVFSLFVVLSRR